MKTTAGKLPTNRNDCLYYLRKNLQLLHCIDIIKTEMRSQRMCSTQSSKASVLVALSNLDDYNELEVFWWCTPYSRPTIIRAAMSLRLMFEMVNLHLAENARLLFLQPQDLTSALTRGGGTSESDTDDIANLAESDEVHQPRESPSSGTLQQEALVLWSREKQQDRQYFQANRPSRNQKPNPEPMASPASASSATPTTTSSLPSPALPSPGTASPATSPPHSHTAGALGSSDDLSSPPATPHHLAKSASVASSIGTVGTPGGTGTATGRQRGARSLLKNYYGLSAATVDSGGGGGGVGDNGSEAGSHDANDDDRGSPGFGSKTGRLKSMGPNPMDMEIKDLDGSMKTLVYGNYNKFIAAADTIRAVESMKGKVENMDAQMAQLQQKMDTITQKSDKINSGLSDKRGRIRQLNGVHTLLRKLNFVFDLPQRLEMCLQAHKYEEAVKLHLATWRLLDHYKNQSIFSKIQEECKYTMNQVASKIRAKMTSEESSVYDISECAGLLFGLGLQAPSDLATEYIRTAGIQLKRTCLQAQKHIFSMKQPEPDTSGSVAQEGSPPSALIVAQLDYFNSTFLRALSDFILKFHEVCLSSSDSVIAATPVLAGPAGEPMTNRAKLTAEQRDQARAALIDGMAELLKDYFEVIDRLIPIPVPPRLKDALNSTFDPTDSITVLEKIGADMRPLVGLVRILDFDDRFESYARDYLARVVKSAMSGAKAAFLESLKELVDQPKETAAILQKVIEALKTQMINSAFPLLERFVDPRLSFKTIKKEEDAAAQSVLDHLIGGVDSFWTELAVYFTTLGEHKFTKVSTPPSPHLLLALSKAAFDLSSLAVETIYNGFASSVVVNAAKKLSPKATSSSTTRSSGDSLRHARHASQPVPGAKDLVIVTASGGTVASATTSIGVMYGAGTGMPSHSRSGTREWGSGGAELDDVWARKRSEVITKGRVVATRWREIAQLLASRLVRRHMLQHDWMAAIEPNALPMEWEEVIRELDGIGVQVRLVCDEVRSPEKPVRDTSPRRNPIIAFPSESPSSTPVRTSPARSSTSTRVAPPPRTSSYVAQKPPPGFLSAALGIGNIKRNFSNEAFSSPLTGDSGKKKGGNAASATPTSLFDSMGGFLQDRPDYYGPVELERSGGFLASASQAVDSGLSFGPDNSAHSSELGSSRHLVCGAKFNRRAAAAVSVAGNASERVQALRATLPSGTIGGQANCRREHFLPIRLNVASPVKLAQPNNMSRATLWSPCQKPIDSMLPRSNARRANAGVAAASATGKAVAGPGRGGPKKLPVALAKRQLDLRPLSVSETVMTRLGFSVIAILVLHLAGIFLFTSGFLLSRLELDDFNNCTFSPAASLSSSDSLGIDRDVPVPPVEAESEAGQCWHKPRYQRAVLIIMDALRFDFTVYNESLAAKAAAENDPSLIPHYINKLPVFHKLLTSQPQNSLLLRVRADPPTTTLQRLKALTTGTLPTFVDVGNSFGGSVVSEDNLIDQLRRLGRRVVFMGDDTWVGLFPTQLSEAHPYPSFNVQDLNTVDEGCVHHLFPTLQRDPKDWDLAVAHFLGVDHAGHSFGPSTLPMALKLTQVNGWLTRVFESLDNETIAIVVGDHGMDPKGDHGGDSENEVNAGLFMYSRGGVWVGTSSVTGDDASRDLLFTVLHEMDKVESEESDDPFVSVDGFRTVPQIDLVPTLALLIGLPIPFGNLGTVIPELFFHSAHSSDADMRNRLENLVVTTRLNARQLHEYLEAYTRKRGVSAEFALPALAQLFNEAEASFMQAQGASNAEQATAALRQAHLLYVRFMRRSLTAARKIWARFDIPLIVIGVVELLLAVFASFVMVSSVWRHGASAAKEALAFAVGGVVGAVVGAATGLVGTLVNVIATALGGHGTDSVMSVLHESIFLAAVGAILAYICFIVTSSDLSKRKDTEAAGLPLAVGNIYSSKRRWIPSADAVMAFALLALLALVPASDSYTILEESVTLYILQAYGIYTLLKAFSTDTLPSSSSGDSKKHSALTRQSRSTILFYAAVFLVLGRLSAASTVCREESMHLCTPTFNALPNASVAAPHSVFALVVVMVVACASLRTLLSDTESLDAPGAAFVGAYCVPAGLVAAVIYWALDTVDGYHLFAARPDLGNATAAADSSASASSVAGGGGLKLTKFWVAKMGFFSLSFLSLYLWGSEPSCMSLRQLRGSPDQPRHSAASASRHSQRAGRTHACYDRHCKPMGGVMIGVGFLQVLCLIEIHAELRMARGKAIRAMRDSEKEEAAGKDKARKRVVAAAQAAAGVAKGSNVGDSLSQPGQTDLTPETEDDESTFGLLFLHTVVLLLLSQRYYFATGHQTTLSSMQWEVSVVGLKQVNWTISPVVMVLNTFAGPLLFAFAAPLLATWKREVTRSTGPRVFKELQTTVLLFVAGLGTITTIATAMAGWFRRHLMVWRVFAPKFLFAAAQLFVLELVIATFCVGGLWLAIRKYRTFLDTLAQKLS
ncbi:hypothetical protein DFJ73DRAFT_763698 [Zopfochytrium polystomum]|nr:hypothetical protein DFJ73DRAFT_763698 [Zopfochytrium polystomum]